MCRFVPEKNLHHLIEAFSRTEHRECKLVIAGDSDFEDDYSASLKKYAREQGVVLPGFIKGRKLHALLSHARCFVLPSSCLLYTSYSLKNYKQGFFLFLAFRLFLNNNINLINLPGVPLLTLEVFMSIFFALLYVCLLYTSYSFF